METPQLVNETELKQILKDSFMPAKPVTKQRGGQPSKETQRKNREKYERVWMIYNDAVTPEGDHKHTLSALCRKHDVSYHSFLLWRKKTTEKKAAMHHNKPTDTPPTPIRQMIGQNRILIRLDDLTDLINTMVRKNLHHYVLELEKQRKLSVID